MTHAEYHRMCSIARYTRRQVRTAHESDDAFYARRLADGTLVMVAVEDSATKASARVPGGLPRRGPDPLTRLRDARNWRHRDLSAYNHVRFVCSTPCWQLRLIESVVGCELAARRAVQAWREVA